MFKAQEIAFFSGKSVSFLWRNVKTTVDPKDPKMDDAIVHKRMSEILREIQDREVQDKEINLTSMDDDDEEEVEVT